MLSALRDQIYTTHVMNCTTQWWVSSVFTTPMSTRADRKEPKPHSNVSISTAPSSRISPSIHFSPNPPTSSIAHAHRMRTFVTDELMHPLPKLSVLRVSSLRRRFMTYTKVSETCKSYQVRPTLNKLWLCDYN